MSGFSLAAVWFGSHCGGGFATGTLAVTYYVKFGAWALIMPLIALLIMVVVVVIQWEVCRSNRAYNYRKFADVLYHPQEKIWGTVFEIMFVVDVVMALAIVFSSAGNLIQGFIPVPYIVATAIFVVIIVALTMFGSQFLLRIGSILSVVLIVCLTLTSISGISANSGNLVSIVSNWETSGSFGSALWSAVLYGSFQCACLATTHAVTEELPDHKSSLWAGIFGFVLNGAMMMLTACMLLSYYPDCIGKNLPTFEILSGLNMPWLLIAYSAALFLALVTTAITCTSSLTARAETFVSKVIKNATTCRVICSAVVLIICFCVAQFGLLAIIQKGYSFIGYLCFPLVIFPTLILGPKRIKKTQEDEA
ncbi:MAG: hypothetical protein LUE31_07920 [Lachnospiraceae bacterium]|nr:hypothetical protein [Lachnospiraceae bacterium]